jgi:hypothetical protein
LGLLGLLTAHLPWLCLLRGLVGLWLSVLVGRNLTRLVLARLPILRRRLGICAILQVLAWLVGAGCVLSGSLLVLHVPVLWRFLAGLCRGCWLGGVGCLLGLSVWLRFFWWWLFGS